MTLGPQGTFSHELATRIGGPDVTLVPSIGAIFKTVVREGTTGIVPLENSEAGGVGQTLDGFYRNPVYITAEYYLPIRYALVGHQGSSTSVLFAHPQAYEQCSVFLDSLGLLVQYTESNAASAAQCAEKKGSAAVIPLHLSEKAGIPAFRTGIENQAENTTRFVSIRCTPEREPAPTKCSIILDPEEDRAGLLYDLLGIMARAKINLTRIESRPSKRKMGQYVFFIDLEPPVSLKWIIRELETFAQVRDLGCYSRKEV